MKNNLLYFKNEYGDADNFPIELVEKVSGACYSFDGYFCISKKKDVVKKTLEYLLGISDFVVVCDDGGFAENVISSLYGKVPLNSIKNVSRTKLALTEKTASEFVEKTLIPAMDKFNSHSYSKSVFRFFGEVKEDLEDILKQAVAESENTLFYRLWTENKYDVLLYVVYDDKTPKMLLDKLNKSIVLNFGDQLYAEDDYSLKQRIVDYATLRRIKMSVAESFTGGNIARTIVSVPGASAMFYEGAVTYDTNAKIERLGVDRQTVDKYTVVSSQVASEMVKGLLSTGNCQVAVSTTGYAGPNVGDEDNAGLCFIGVGTEKGINVYKFKFDGSRNEIINEATSYALFLAFKEIKNY